jgi:hypothetical protein
MIADPEKFIFMSLDLDRKDIEVLLHLINYLYGGTSLPPKELQHWKKVGVISQNNRILLDPLFFFDETHSSLFVSYWLKLLLLYRNVTKLQIRPQNNVD